MRLLETDLIELNSEFGLGREKSRLGPSMLCGIPAYRRVEAVCPGG